MAEVDYCCHAWRFRPFLAATDRVDPGLRHTRNIRFVSKSSHGTERELEREDRCKSLFLRPRGYSSLPILPLTSWMARRN